MNASIVTPLSFEAAHAEAWRELEAALAALETGRRRPAAATGTRLPAAPVDAARVAALYRLSCEHLALARARAYPVHLIDRLEALTQRAHQLIYRRSELGLARLGRFFGVDFPQAVRRRAGYVWVAAAVFYLPMIAIGIQCYLDPGFILTLHDAAEVAQYDSMYGDGTGVPLGRDAGTDLAMFGYYIRNNIGIAFQCFASGLFLGVGSLLTLAYNGLAGGSVAGYLTAAGHAGNFYSFVVTHGAFELTAIVIAGGAGLMLGHALLAPGRRTRLQALRHATGDAVPLVYGVVVLLLIAAGVEAFWSSARWIAPAVKYGVGAACWAGVIGYLVAQGRPAPAPPAATARSGAR